MRCGRLFCPVKVQFKVVSNKVDCACVSVCVTANKQCSGGDQLADKSNIVFLKETRHGCEDSC